MITAIALATVIQTSFEPAPMSLYDFKMKNIDGKETPLKKYKGKVLLVVNVASQCGLTPQYEALESTYQKYKEKGFAVLGFPANEFGGQEPGTNAEIKAFCTGEYHVTFPMFSKIVVKGEGIHPLYQWLLKSTDNKKDIEWNFEKFVVGKDGKIIARFHPSTKPDDKKLIAVIDKALSEGHK